MDRLPSAAISVAVALALSVGYIYAAEGVIGALPEVVRSRARPWLWLGPAGAFLGFFLVFPTIYTVALSFRGADSSTWVGLANYRAVLTDPAVLAAIRNNLIWVIAFPSITVVAGLAVALLAERVPYEGIVRSVIFLPMAVSFVAAGVIWRFMYAYNPPPLPQTGTLNALLTWAVPGFEPRAWLVDSPPLNNLALIVAAAWVWTGFCMVIFSAALKGIPSELIEAAGVDGASDLQIVRHVVVPMLTPTVVVVTTTMVISALKAFDVVYVMTSGNFDTEVLASRIYKEMFTSRDFGRASALAVLLLAAVVPIMLINLRRFRAEAQARRAP